VPFGCVLARSGTFARGRLLMLALMASIAVSGCSTDSIRVTVADYQRVYSGIRGQATCEKDTNYFLFGVVVRNEGGGDVRVAPAFFQAETHSGRVIPAAVGDRSVDAVQRATSLFSSSIRDLPSVTLATGQQADGYVGFYDPHSRTGEGETLARLSFRPSGTGKAVELSVPTENLCTYY